MLSCTMVGAMLVWIAIVGSPFSAVIPGAVLLALLAVAAPSLLRLRSRD